ncbi:MAG: hypothetical protein UY63_C0004G0040 [Parcubacteria group bacterium GW2011_GWA2_51_10]|nr:MAG: hypothetical protein UY63_C0004G0040 [Parcubacteria group bacterium GW2011_GWA2_51_10]
MRRWNTLLGINTLLLAIAFAYFIFSIGNAILNAAGKQLLISIGIVALLILTEAICASKAE